ncbi:MAG TPA: response regulator transcription factor [Actinomycetota bacterium]|nr:response regulator transcription factor [Actinomycetota bacterium]
MDDGIHTLVVGDRPRFAQELARVLRGSSAVSMIGLVPDAEGVAALASSTRLNVVIVDLDREDEQGLITLMAVCQVLDGPRVLVSTCRQADPALGAAVVMAGASGVLPAARTRAALEDALRRALAGELVLPDDHLASLVQQVPLSEAGDAAAAHLGSLTARELEVLRLLADGSTTGEIAALLNISPTTVQSHVKNVLAKLGVHSKVEAVRVAWRAGAIATPASA